MRTQILLLACLVLLVDCAAAQEKSFDPALTPKDREHWAFRRPVRHALPKHEPAAANPIDAFILARLKKEGLAFSPQADPATLIRRVALDLTGLPPSPNEVEAFLNDRAPDAYEKLVDRLLASPHFGERQAQHWLDVVRFAESNGFELDADRPQAWRYRDYVVKSFNDDKPYNQFVIEQIAGDEHAAGKDARESAELWIATGLHRCGPVHMVSGNLDAGVLRQEMLTEMVNGVGSVFLGLTIGCARCHDHKFDPISAGDYYRLQAYFSAARYADVDFSTEAERTARKKASSDLEALAAPIKKQIAAIDAPYRNQVMRAKRENLEPKYRAALETPADQRTAEQKKLASEATTLIKVTWDEILAALTPADRETRTALRAQLHEIECRMPAPLPAAWAIRNGKADETFVLKRGDPKRKLQQVSAGVPRVLTDDSSKPATRLELAKWIASEDNPLTARVIVNRIWQSHFGRGLVATPNDFGTRGERPSHPELLDWLASELVEKKWSLKMIHRLIVTSSTYRQSTMTTQGLALDPDNQLLWRMNRRRLEAEAIRDSILSAAETLNRKVGGPSVRVPLEPEVYGLIFTEGEPDGLWPVAPDEAEHVRRSIYLFSKRNVRLPLLEAFDQPDTLNSCAYRPVSTFAPQALILMNAPFVRDQARALAVRIVKKSGSDGERPILALYRQCLGRTPTDQERRLAREFLVAQSDSVRDRLRSRKPIGLDDRDLPRGADLAKTRALADLAAAIFNTHEFVYIP